MWRNVERLYVIVSTNRMIESINHGVKSINTRKKAYDRSGLIPYAIGFFVI